MLNYGWVNPLIALIVAAVLDWLLLPALGTLLPGVIISLLHVLLVIVMIVAVIFLILGLVGLVRR